MDILQQTLAEFDLRDPEEIARTGIATVWKVMQPDGKPAALKIYDDLNEHDEGLGFLVLEAWQDVAAAKVIHRRKGIVMLEWLGGQTLADVSRGGRDAEANAILVDVARRCHAVPVADLSPFETLSDMFAPLFNLTFADDCPKDVHAAINACRVLVTELLDTQPAAQLLHRDLHHENVIEGPRGWCVIDAKGVVGDPAYELANAFRNPLGDDDLIRDPARTHALATIWSKACGCSKKRALQWAAAHTAISMTWACDGVLGKMADSDLPAFYLAQSQLA